MNRPAVVLLTRDGIEHRYVARILAERLPDLQLIVEFGSRGGWRRAIRRTWRSGPEAFAEKVARTLYCRLVRYTAARSRALVDHLGAPERARPLFDRANLVKSVNAPESVERLREWQPKLVLVYGTGLVRSPAFNAIDCTILNLHTGLSPYYRGSACHLWPLFDDRLDRIGVTVHECTPTIDGGDILATRLVEIQPGDTVHDVFARQVFEGGPLYARCAEAELSTPLARTPQDLSLGHEYRLVEWGLSVELAARRRLRRLRREG